MEFIAIVIIGIVCVIIGIFNIHGNISMLHSYHTKRVKEEDKLPFGRLVGAGIITIGVGLVAAGVLYYLASALQESIYATVSMVALISAIVVGLAVASYAMFKYNKGIF